MGVRVIGGMYGGRKLDTPPGDKTHPMGERIRNALFNSLGDSLKGARVLDIFAGTGAVGIEAISRGAKSAVFVERDKIAQKCISNNIEALGITNAELIKASVSNWLASYKGDTFDIIFADPPYYDPQRATIERTLTLLKPKGILVVSWPEKQPAPQFENMQVTFERTYAGARIIMYANV